MLNAPNMQWSDGPANDYHLLPVTEKQMRYARAIAERSALEIPVEAQRDRRVLSAWVSAHRPAAQSRFDRYPSGKQVAYAERIARAKHRRVPPECFHDKSAMSAWIDRNR
ncbi:hypothetical protein [Ruegeria marina]|uniref:Uncharacterized protein n=1 Tax=Ruegeria marina TaxID=639004 RepID=A0A1G7ABG4_9RHOB|nr:hypothetical protein [Ruegeria marina]SDE12298.1 hypothetical protein SAMN04488239_11469 [Ruegeria marina]